MTFAIDACLVVLACAVPIAIEMIRGLEHGGSDLGTLFVPNMAWWWNRGRHGGGWNPWIFGGYPADADPLVGQLHPLGAFYALLPPFTAAALEACVVPGITALGMLVYLRGLGCGRTPRLVGGLSFALGGFVAAQAVHPPLLRTVAAIPWALVAIDELDGPALIAAFGLAVAAMIAGGHPQTIAYSLAIVVWYALAGSVQLTRRRASCLAAGVALGIALTASAWLPAGQLIASSTQASGSSSVIAFHAVRNDPDRLASLPLLAGLLVPFSAGGAAFWPYGPSPWQPPCGVVECTGYPGMTPWLAVLAAIPILIRDSRGRFWLAVAALGVVLSTGVIGEIPPIRGVRAPVRFLLFWNLGMAVAAALALQAAERKQAGVQEWYVATGVLTLALGLAGLAHVMAWRLVASGAVVLALSAAGGLMWIRRRWCAGWILVGVLLADLVAFAVSLPVGTVPGRYTRTIAMMRGLRVAAHDELDRVLVLPPPPDANWAWAAHARMLQGFNALVPQQLAALLGERPGSRSTEIGLVADSTLASPASHVLDLLRCGVVGIHASGTNPLSRAIAQDAPEEGRFERRATGVGGIDVYLNRRVRPVAWLVHEVLVLPPETILRRIRGEDSGATFDPARQALAARPIAGVSPALPGEPAETAVDILSYGDDEIRLAASPATAALLVTSELSYPGWTATINGRSAGVETVNGGFRAVVVPAGLHQVTLTYRPRFRRIGYEIAAVAVAATFGCAWFFRRRRIHMASAG